MTPQESEQLQGIVRRMGNDVDYPESTRYLIKTARADIPTGNNRRYSAEEIKAAARSMGYRHLDINHDKIGKRLPEPQNQTIGAEWDESTNSLWTLIRVADPVVKSMIENGQIRQASVETRHSCSKSAMGMGMCDVEHLYYTGLGLLTNDISAGDAATQIYGFESLKAPEISRAGLESVEFADMIKAVQEEKDAESGKIPIRNPPPSEEQKEIMSSPAKIETTSNTAPNSTPVNNSAPEQPAVAVTANNSPAAGGAAGPLPGQQAAPQPTAAAAQAHQTAVQETATRPATSSSGAPAESRPGAEMMAQIPKQIPDGKGVASPSVQGNEAARFERIASMMRNGMNFGGMSSSQMSGQEAVTADGNPNAIGKIWLPDMINLPVGLAANLRSTCRQETIERGADTAYFFTITIPEFVQRVLSTTENTEESDSTHTITRIAASVKVKTSKNTVSYEAIQFIKGNVVQAIEQGFQEAAIISEDEEVLLALDAEADNSFAGAIYGDGSVNAEGSITSGMTFTEDRLLEAITDIAASKHMATNLVAVMHPRQAGAMIKRDAYKNAATSGDNGSFNRNGIFDTKYGITLRMSTKVSTGLGSPTTLTTYRAYVYKAGYAVGLAISRELDTEMLKTFKMSWILRAFHYIVAKVLVNKAIVKIITA